jgi:uncharacterized protein
VSKPRPTARLIPPDGFAPYLRDLLRTHEAVVASYLFGSVVSGTAGPLSDIDVGLLLDERALDAAGRLAEAARIHTLLQRRLDRPVQVVVLNDSSPQLVHRVLRASTPLTGGESPVRVAFESHALTEYLDFQPLLDRYDEALFARAREGRIGS